jgi:predicted RecA/RadA family phage recombinase
MSVLTGPRMASPAVDSLTRHSTAQTAVGTMAYSDDGEFVYVTASGTIASGSPVSASGTLAAVLEGDLDTGAFLGVAEAAFTSGQSGFIRTKGICNAVVASGTTVGLELQLSATGGQLKPITTSGSAVAVALQANASAAAAKSVFLR